MVCIPRQLSDPEYVQFLTDVDVANLGLPPWGGIVNWGNQSVLVYQVPDGGTWLTDVTSCASATAGYPKTYTEHGSAYYFTQEFAAQFLEDMSAQAQQVGSQIEAVSTFIGEHILKPVFKPVTFPLELIAVIAIAALAFLYAPRPRQ